MKRRLLAVALGFTLLWLAEIGLRLAGVESAYQPTVGAGWRMNPNLDDHVMTGQEGHEFRVNTNADGLRTGAARAPSDRRRIVVMGDSTVFGWGVEDEETVPGAMQDALPGWEVVNAGQPGYTTWQIGALWDEVIRHYAPDVVLVFIPNHDFNQALVSDRQRIEGGARMALMQHSRIYALLRTLVFRHAGREYLMPHESGAEPRVPRVPAADRAQVFEAIAAETRLAVGLLPFHNDLAGQPSVLGVEDELQDYVALGAWTVNLRACCVGTPEDADARTFAFDRGHLNGLGNAEVGQAAARRLLELDDDGPG